MIVRLSTFAIGALCLSAAPFASALSPSEIPPDTPVSQLLASANTNLAQGNAQDALVYFDVAIQRDPKNYLTIFKRGAAYLSLGKNVQAARDFDQVLTLKPGFEGALMQRAKIKSRKADWAGAKADYVEAKKQDGQEMEDLIQAEGAEKLAAEAEAAKDWDACVSNAGIAIMVAGTAPELRRRRARCRFAKGEVMEGIADLHHVAKINPALTEPHLKIAAMTYYSLGETEKGLNAISKCLHNDPDSKECLALRKSMKGIDRTLKKLDKMFERRQYATAVKLLVPQSNGDAGLLQEIKDDTNAFREKGYIHEEATNTLYASLIEKTCEAYSEMNNPKKSAQYCDEALTWNPNSLHALLSKAQRQIDTDDFEPAIATLNLAKEHHGDNASPKLSELLHKAHTLLKRSKTKDYYKVLGVTRDADAREIKKAFRRLTVQHHPDKAAANGYTPEAAQKKMSEINEAYEVLSDPELRERFDRGDDPNDPSAQQGGNPFQGSPFGSQQMFFQQGRGGGSGFKFQASGHAGGNPFAFGGGFPF